MTAILKTSDGLIAVVEIERFEPIIHRAMKKILHTRLQGGDYEQYHSVYGIRRYKFIRRELGTDTPIFEEVVE